MISDAWLTSQMIGLGSAGAISIYVWCPIVGLFPSGSAGGRTA
jgi:hypothetical protein